MVYQIYIILKPVLDRGDILHYLTWLYLENIFINYHINIIFYFTTSISKTSTVYKVWLVLIPIIIAFTIKYLGNLIDGLLPPKNNDPISTPVTIPNFTPINYSENNSNINTPVTMPNLEELGNVLSDVQQTGGKDQKQKLSNYIKNLNELSDYFKNGKIGNQQIVDRIKDDNALI